MFVGVVACAAFAGHSVVQGEAVHGEVVCVACLVLKDDSALDEFVDAAADGAFVHQEHFAGCLAIQQETVVFSDKRKDVEQQPQVCSLQARILGKQTCIGWNNVTKGPAP